MSDQSTQRGRFYKGQRGKINVPLRPLTKGIVRNTSPTMIPTGGLFDASGFVPSTSGLIRRAPLDLLSSVTFPTVQRYDYIDSFVDDDGSRVTYAIADGKFYEVSGPDFIERPCEYLSTEDSPASTISGALDSLSIVGVDTSFTTRSLIRGDELIVDIGGTEYTYTIDIIGSDLSLSVTDNINPEIPAGTAFKIKRKLFPAPEWQIQVERFDRLLYICTGTRPLVAYDIDNPSRVLPIDYARPFVPKTIKVFGDRVWVGNSLIPSVMNPGVSGDRRYTNRMSWSLIVAEPGYTPTVPGAVDLNPVRNFVDRVEIGGEISALSILGPYLVSFFEFGVEYGRKTSVPGDTLPLAFDGVETGNRGVLQPGAITSTKNGIFFVSTSNVIFLGQNLVVEDVSDSVQEEMFRPEVLKSRFKIHNFVGVEGLIIGSSENEDTYEEFWVFNLETGAWTRFFYSCAYFNIFTFGSRLTYFNYPDSQIYGVRPPGENDDALGNPLPDSPTAGTTVPVFPPIDNPQYVLVDDPINGSPGYTEETAVYGGASDTQSLSTFYATVENYITVWSVDSVRDYISQPVYALLETGDFDFGRPDNNKTIYKIAMRLRDTAPGDIVYHVEGSIDSGDTWYDMTDLIIYAGGKEGKASMIFTGSAPRLRLTTNSEVLLYEIVEMTIDVKSRGRQFSDT